VPLGTEVDVGPGDIVLYGYNRHGPTIGGCAPFHGGAGFPSKTKSRWLRPISVPSGILIRPPLGHSRHGPKLRRSCPPFLRGAGSPSNAKLHGPRLTSIKRAF